MPEVIPKMMFEKIAFGFFLNKKTILAPKLVAANMAMMDIID